MKAYGCAEGSDCKSTKELAADPAQVGARAGSGLRRGACQGRANWRKERRKKCLDRL